MATNAEIEIIRLLTEIKNNSDAQLASEPLLIGLAIGTFIGTLGIYTLNHVFYKHKWNAKDGKG